MGNTNNGILFRHKKRWSTNICYKMGEPEKHSAGWKKTDTKCHTLYDSSDAKRPQEANLTTERLVVAGTGGGEIKSRCLMDTKFLFGWWNVLKLDSNNDCTTCKYTKKHRIRYFKVVRMANFILCEFYHKKLIT